MISLKNVSKSYPLRHGARLILDNISFDIQKGERVGILGKNGSGKSTLIRLLSGSELPDSGTITRNMRVSWPLGLNGGFQGSLTGIDNINFLCRIYDAPVKQSISFIEEFTQLGHYLREPVKTYSSGMLARLAFAISFMIDFDCYLIDETLSVGDARFQELCRYELQDRRKEAAMVLVSHLPQHIKMFCTTVYILNLGKIIYFQSPKEALDYYLELQELGSIEFRD